MLKKHKCEKAGTSLFISERAISCIIIITTITLNLVTLCLSIQEAAANGDDACEQQQQQP
jgi:hypothetical protein